MKRFFDLLKTNFPEGSVLFKKDAPKRVSELDLIEMNLRQVICNGANQFVKKIHINSFGAHGFIESCDVNFLGTIRSPFITNIKFKISNFQNFQPDRDIEERIVLEKAVEAMILNAISSLLNLGCLYVINKCNQDFPDDPAIVSRFLSIENHFLIVENLQTDLSFNHKQEPEILLTYLPSIRCASRVPITKTFENTSHGDNINAITFGLIDIHKQFLKELFKV